MGKLWKSDPAPASSDKRVAQHADVVIAVMGVTGAGKSSFIASVTGRKDIQVGHGLYSETSEVKAYRFSNGTTNYVLVDTPGFDDSSMSNEEVKTKIVQWLTTSYNSGTRLNGLIYIHDIRKSRIQGSAYQNMRLFSQLCGDKGLRNVIFATSFWDQVTESVGAQREQELMTSKDFWANMIAKGSQVVRISPDRSVYLGVLERIAANNKVDLLLAPRENVLLKNKRGGATIEENARSRSSEIQEFEETLAEEKKAEKKRVQEKLRESEKAHQRDMKQLRTEQKKSQKQAQQTQRRAEKGHKREVREQRWHMQQEQREIEKSIRRMEPKHKKYIRLYMFTAFWLLLATCLTGNVIEDSLKRTPAGVNYAMFTITWAWLALLVGMASYSLSFVPLIAVLSCDILATIFTFCAAVELAANLGVHSCFNNRYLKSNILIVGSSNFSKRCQELQASDAFLWFIFMCFIFITAMNVARAMTMGGAVSSEASRIRGIAMMYF